MSTVHLPESFLRAFYFIASLVVLLVYLTPTLNRRFLAYGARESVGLASGKGTISSSITRRDGIRATRGFLDQVADLKVPHHWFAHFYMVSVASSIFWAHQILTRGPLYTFLESYTAETGDPDDCARIVGCWFLLAVQGLRRLYESLRSPRSSSKMWVGHYAIGIAFYLATGVAIWIEGIPALKGYWTPGRRGWYHVNNLSTYPPLLLDVVANACFFKASIDQHTLHKHLASLKKYTPPTKLAFAWIIAPHYTCECMIYLCLAFLSRSSRLWPNHTMGMALIFVVINLGISADGTRAWMRSKFGDASVTRKWRMLPGSW